jgi:ABC-2 type transport system permease protein
MFNYDGGEMRNIIVAEIFKLNKRHIFGVISLFNFIILICAMAMRFKWEFISFGNGETLKLSLSQFNLMSWEFLIYTGFTFIFFMFIAASILANESNEGQILLAITRVASRKKLILAKFLTLLILEITFFVSNLFISSLSYILFVWHSDYGINNLLKNFKILTFDNVASLLLLALLMSISLLFAVKKSTFFAVFVGFVIYLLLMMISRIDRIAAWVPGALTLNSKLNTTLFIGIYQCIILIVSLAIFLVLAIKRFEQRDF